MITTIIDDWESNRSTRNFKMHQERVNWDEHVAYHLHHREDGKKFAQTYRMPYEDFTGLVNSIWKMVYIDELKSLNSTKGETDPIFPELVVALGIRWISGDTASSLADWAGISDGSFRRCRDLFLDAIIFSDEPKLQIAWPDTMPVIRKNAAGFQNKATEHVVFPNCIGCIDKLLLRTIQPKGVDNP